MDNIAQNPVPPIFTPPPAVPEPPKRKSYTWLLILILFFLAFGLSFLSWENYRLRNQLAQVVQLSPSPISTSTDLSEKTNALPAKYEIIFPSSWTEIKSFTREGINQNLDKIVSSAQSEAISLDTLYPYPFVAIYTKPLLSENEWDQWVKEFSSFRDVEFTRTSMFGVEVIIAKGEEIVLGLTPGGWNLRWVIFRSPDKKDAYSILVADDKNYSQKKSLDSILSTFKFTDPQLESQLLDTTDWGNFGSRTNSFSIKYPTNFNCGQSDTSGMEKYDSCTYYGSQARKNTEMSDGVLIFFQLHRQSENYSLESVVNSAITQSKQNSEIIRDKNAINIHAYSGYSYTARGLGESQYIYLHWPEPEPYNYSYLEIISVIADPSNNGYQKIVDSMLSTIEFSGI